MSDERTIEKCPFCGDVCRISKRSRSLYCISPSCAYKLEVNQNNITLDAAITAHNVLCKLVKWGCEYPILLEHHNRRSGIADEFRRQRDEAVEKGRIHEKCIKAIKETLGAMYDRVHDERDKLAELLTSMRLMSVGAGEDREAEIALYKEVDTYLISIGKKIGGGE